MGVGSEKKKHILSVKASFKIKHILDPRALEFARGRSINLALSNRARRALQKVEIEERILKCGIPMKGRYIHNISGNNKSILYDPRTKQVYICIIINDNCFTHIQLFYSASIRFRGTI